MPDDQLKNRMATQNREFDAVAQLAEQYRRLMLTPVVDDDYPEARYRYEGAVRDVLKAFQENGRLSPESQSQGERLMKIEIQGEPRFDFALTTAQLDVLEKLARNHYDAVCRATIRFDAGHDDGFIYKWRACIKQTNAHYVHRASWRQLDTCLKIMELTGSLTPEEKKVRDELTHDFNAVMDIARDARPRWASTYESTRSQGRKK